MAFALRAGQVATAVNTGGLVLPHLALPAAPLAGNVLAFIPAVNSNSAAGLPVPGFSAGWALGVSKRAASASRQLSIFWHIVQAGDANSFDYTGGAGNRIDGLIAEFTDAAGDVPTLDTAAAGADLTASGTQTGAMPVAATAGNDDLLIAAAYTSANVTAGHDNAGVTALLGATNRLIVTSGVLAGTGQTPAPNLGWTTAAQVIATAVTISRTAIARAVGGFGPIPIV